MAYNGEKNRWECDRCGSKIPNTKIIQLCPKCERWLKEQAQKDEANKHEENKE